MKRVYVALLRGINVGGKNKVDMKILKKTFENLGFDSVVTYINSGNIIFKSDIKSKKELEDKIEKAILKDFKLNIKTLIRSKEDIDIIIKNLPDSWQNNENMKSNVMFLWEEIDNKNIINELNIKDKIDIVKYVKGTILWNAKMEFITKSGLMDLAKSQIYKKMTIRNVNTTRKIHELMSISF